MTVGVAALSETLFRQVMDYLEVDADHLTLDQLVTAYVKHVPWESASRIVRRQAVTVLQERPRWPELFWQDAMRYGTGGTCFESNYAFFCLMQNLGYRGYLTINNMGETRACHTAIVIEQNDARFLVDVGLPVHLPLPLARDHMTSVETLPHTYSAHPHLTPSVDVYEIRRDRHPRPYCFTFIDQPIHDADYRDAVTADYDANGFFLDQVVLVKTIDGIVHRFNSADGFPYQMEVFKPEGTVYQYLGDTAPTIAANLAFYYAIAPNIIQKALECLGIP